MTKQELVNKLIKSPAFKNEKMTEAWVDTFAYYNDLKELSPDDFEVKIYKNEVDVMLNGTTIETFGMSKK